MIKQLPTELYAPQLPKHRERFTIAFAGCGSVVRRWQLPHYIANAFRVKGAFDQDTGAIEQARAIQPSLVAYSNFEALLDDSEIDIVDIATTVHGRADLIIRALKAGKHVLAQKPLCLNADELSQIAAAASNSRGKLAVNFNGRWSPQWRAARNLIERGAIGEILAITHFHDFSMQWDLDVARHGSEHFLLFDYCIHWIDISQIWLGTRKQFDVRAHAVTRDADEERITQTAWIDLLADASVSTHIRSVASAQRYWGHAFVIHGSAGALRGAVDAPVDGEHLILDRPGGIMRIGLSGSWFPDGFVGSMADLMCAVEQDREPDAGIKSAGLTQRLAFAAQESARANGVSLEVFS